MAHASHAVPVSLDLQPSHTCYSCHAIQNDICPMFACPTCDEFICENNTECNGRCRCELTLKFHGINSENVAQFGGTPLSFIKDEDGRYVAVGDLYAERFDAQIGYTDHELFNRHTADHIRAVDLEVLETGSVVERINEIVTDHGVQYWLVEKSLMLAKGKRFISGVCRDITALVRTAGASGLS